MAIPFKNNCINFYPLNNNFDSLTGIKPNSYSGTFNSSEKCIEFKGSEYIDFPLSALELPSHNFSIILQVKLNIKSGDEGIIWIGSLGANNPTWSKGLYCNASSIYLGAANSGNVYGWGQSISNGISLFNTIDDFDTIVITDTEEFCKLYINGKLIATSENPGITPTSGSITLGKHDGYCNGLYRNLGSYNIVFTEEQVKQITFNYESQKIKSLIKDTILNNKLFREHCILYENEEE